MLCEDLVLDLVTGGDLLDYIIESDGLSEERARHLTYQMCDALAVSFFLFISLCADVNDIEIK